MPHPDISYGKEKVDCDVDWKMMKSDQVDCTASFGQGEFPYQQMLESILQQEALFRDFSVEHSTWRTQIQHQLGHLKDRLDHLHGHFVDNIVQDHGEDPIELVQGNATAANETRKQHSGQTHEEADHFTEGTEQRLSKLNEIVAQKKSVLGKLEDEQHWLVMHTNSRMFEYAMSIVIAVNVLCMSVHLQWQGYSVEHKLGLRNSDAGWADVELAFEMLEKLFCVLYLVEMLLRIWAMGWTFFAHAFNVIDALVVLITCIEAFILRSLVATQFTNLTILRLVRVFRVLRIVKLVRFAENLRELRILIRTLAQSCQGIVWSMILVLLVIFAASILINALIHPFMDDESISITSRQEMFELFGTFTKAFETMFESTFTGGWRFYTRPLYKDFSYFFHFFWIPYIVCVNFTLLRVIAALFLKQMFAVAEHDSERLAMEKMKERERFATELRLIFKDADSSGDGAISEDEFQEMILLPSVAKRFQKLDLEMDEVVALFSVLSADDGNADYEEFLNGALKMKSSARTIDTVQILHQQLAMHRAIEDVHEAMEKIGRRIMPSASSLRSTSTASANRSKSKSGHSLSLQRAASQK